MQEAAIKSLGADVIIQQDPTDMDELRIIASRFDVIINPGFGALPDPSKALTLELGDRKKETPNRQVPHIIQQSGTSNLADRPHTIVQRKLQYEFNDFDSKEIYD